MEKPRQIQTKNASTPPFPRSELVTLGVVLAVGTLVSWLWLGRMTAGAFPAVAAQTPTVAVAEKKPATLQTYRALDGMPVAPGKEFPFPVGVMIENLPEVRPQSGLSDASIVYETLAEGGATRFLAVLAGPGDHLEKIGPVRSVRPYYLEWLSEFGGAIAHAGGSPDALQMISGFAMHDLNGIGSQGRYFYRDHGIGAPHNLFTNSDMLTKALRDTGGSDLHPSFVLWRYKDDLPLADRPSGEPYVVIKFSGYAFETEYRYRRVTNTYARFNSGVSHTDALTGEQLQAKNVIVQIVPKILNFGEKGRITLDVHGGGKALIFVDGGVNVGTWAKKDRTSRTEFFFEDGKPAELDRGATWVAVVPEDKAVEYGTR